MNPAAEHLYTEYTFPVRDPLWKNIYLSPQFKEILSLDEFQKLGRIKQLGPAFHVYPGAVHTRLNHSLGVFHLGKEILKSFLSFGNGGFITTEGVKTFLCSALFHDLGHFPFAHSLKELPLKDHEELSAEIILSADFSVKLKNILKIDPYFVAAIIDRNMDTMGNREVEFYRKVLSGTLDPDKLDYLNRDAYFCGIPYGTQDTDFIVRKLRVFKGEPALESSAVMAVENLLFSKYLMYKSVYWHKTVRIATSMIKKAIFMGLEEKIIRPSDLYNIDDEQFFQILSKRNFSPFNLIHRVMSRDFYKSVMEINFDPANKTHMNLTDLHSRFALSERIASVLSGKSGRDISPVSIIIDIPEAISFEVDMKITGDAEAEYLSSDISVFSSGVVEGFTNSIRKIRLFVPREITGISESWKDFFI